MAVAHVAVDFRLRRERGDRVNNDYIKRTRLAKLLADGERLFAAVGLRNNQVVKIDANLLRVARVKRVLCVDERRDAARLLRIGDDMQRKRRLAGRFLSITFHNASAGKPPYTKRHVERKRAR